MLDWRSRYPNDARGQEKYNKKIVITMILATLLELSEDLSLGKSFKSTSVCLVTLFCLLPECVECLLVGMMAEGVKGSLDGMIAEGVKGSLVGMMAQVPCATAIINIVTQRKSLTYFIIIIDT